MADPQPELTRQLRTCHSLPFPAGSLVPRLAAAGPSPWLPKATPQQRAGFAVSTMVREDRAAAQKVTSGAGGRISVPPTRDYFMAAQEWASRHVHRMPRGEPLVHLTRALSHLVDSEHADYNVSQLLDRQALAATGFKRPRAADKADRNTQCYAAPTYRCACTNATQALGEAAPPDRHCLDRVKAHLQYTADGCWTLLTLMFVKQLHTHLAIGARKDVHPNAVSFLYQPLLALLQNLAERTGRPAAVAAALRRTLSKLWPYTVHTDADGAIVLDLDFFPACFDPRQPDLYGNAESQAALTLVLASAQLDDPCSPEQAEELTREVSGLALEVAAALTDPQIDAVLPLTEKHARYWKNAWEELRRSARESAAVHGKPSPFTFFDPVLLSRAYRLMQYAEWVRQRWPKARPVGPNATAFAKVKPA